MSEASNNDFFATKKPSFVFGTIVGFQGLQGIVKVRPESNKPEVQEHVTRLRTKETNQFPATDLEIDSIEFEKRMFYLSFIDYPDRTSVEHLMGAVLMAWEDEIDDLEEEEFWIKDLIGLMVVKDNGEEVGKIIDIVYGGNDLLEVRREQDPPGKTILIPFVKNIVPTIDFSLRKVIVSDIPGLFEAQ